MKMKIFTKLLMSAIRNVVSWEDQHDL
jgi:hypothetical protein